MNRVFRFLRTFVVGVLAAAPVSASFAVPTFSFASASGALHSSGSRSVAVVASGFGDLDAYRFSGLRDPGAFRVIDVAEGPFRGAGVAAAKAAVGARRGDAGYDRRADMDDNRVVDIRDIAAISRRLPAGSACPASRRDNPECRGEASGLPSGRRVPGHSNILVDVVMNSQETA